jgi:hypothetical protein
VPEDTAVEIVGSVTGPTIDCKYPLLNLLGHRIGNWDNLIVPVMLNDKSIVLGSDSVNSLSVSRFCRALTDSRHQSSPDFDLSEQCPDFIWRRPGHHNGQFTWALG